MLCPRLPLFCALLGALTAANLSFGSPEPVASPSPPPIASEIEAVVQAGFERAAPAVVKVESDHRVGLLSGTGFFISASGTIATSASLAMDTRAITVTVGEERYPAHPLLVDPRSGVALLKIEADTPFLSAFDQPTVVVGTPLLAIGYSLDFPLSPAFGLVAGFDHRVGDRFLSTTHIRAAIPCQPGQAGSPVLTLDGRLAGILVTSLAGGAGCHILPVQAAAKVYEDYLRFGHVMHGWVGVTVEETEEPVADSRARIVDLVENTPAALSGMANGDFVVRVGDVRIHAPLDIIDASYFLTAGDPVAVTVVRGSETLQFQVQPAYHPALAMLAPIGAVPMLPPRPVKLSLQMGAEKGLFVP